MPQGDPPVYQLVDSNGNVQAELRHDLAQSLIIDQLNGSDIDFQDSDLSNIASVSTDTIEVTDGLVPGEIIGSDSGQTDTLSVNVSSPTDYEQIIVFVEESFITEPTTTSTIDYLLSLGGTGEYRGRFNDDTTYNQTNGLPVFRVTTGESITPSGAITLSRGRFQGEWAFESGLFFPQSQSRAEKVAVLGGYVGPWPDNTPIEISNLDNSQQQAMAVYGVR